MQRDAVEYDMNDGAMIMNRIARCFILKKQKNNLLGIYQGMKRRRIHLSDTVL